MGIGMMMTGVVRVRMPVIVTVAVMMMVLVTVPMIVMMRVMMVRGGADAFDVMMVALLGQRHLVLEAEELHAVLAHLAVHVAGAGEDFLDARGEGVEHQGMVVERGRLDELDPGMARGDEVRV